MNIYRKLILIALLPCFAYSMQTQKTELHIEAAKCDVIHNKVHQILDQNAASVHMQDGDGNTPLHEAAYFGCKENADLLLRYGADVNKHNFKEETPLDKAHYMNQQSLENLLKEYGGQYSIYKHLNKRLKQAELDKILWNASKSVNTWNHNYYYKMLNALKQGANPNAMHVDEYGIKMTPLHKIAQLADYSTPYKVMEVLLQYGADINKLDSAGWTPFGRASQGADAQTGDHILKFFRDRKAQFKRVR